MAETVVSFVINQLSTILLQEANVLGGLQQEVQNIKDELGHMRAFLHVAETREEDHPGIHEWVKQVREAAYEIEDLLDEFTLLHSSHRQAKGCYGRCKRMINRIRNIKAHHSIASEIQATKIRLKYIDEARKRYHFENAPLQPHSVVPAPMANSWWDDALLDGKAKLVGIQEPKQQLISQLLQADPRLKVISVVGMQGIGKTTLVRKVHEDAAVTNQFQVKAWVTVPQSHSPMELLNNLFCQICEQVKKPIFKIAGGIERFKSAIHSLLQEKRYVIVFDDVSDIDFWDSIIPALPGGSHGSRVMLTTRIPEVAQATGLESQPYVHKMKPLSSEESWNLFCHRTFKDNCPSHLESIAQYILAKCQGLPLAIVTMSGLLASKDKNKVEEWETVQRSIGREEEGLGNLDMVKSMTRLSYKNLPPHLKTCLLYMSLFPPGYDIQCHRLIQLWIAERFVPGQVGTTYEQVASDYLKELVRRSLVQVVEFRDGSPDKCRVHDLVREMILSKSQEQSLVTIVRKGEQIREHEKVFRLVIDHSLPTLQESKNFSHLRSLITFGSMESQTPEVLNELLSSKLLKVLDFRDTKLEDIPKGVFDLYHLKYLCLRGTRIKTIPKSIRKLQNLEHLHLGETNVIELPNEILKLQKLRHLRVFQVVNFDSLDIGHQCQGFRPPLNIGELHSLHTLLFIDAQNDKATIVGEIGKLIQLRELGITKLRQEDGEGLCNSLEKLINLQELDIAASEKDEAINLNFPLSQASLQSLRSLILRGELKGLPSWIYQLHSLMKIELIWSMLSDDPLPLLQHLPNLVQVCFARAYEGQRLHFRAGGFKKLEMLNLEDMNELRSMVIEKGSMPRLRQLHLSGLPSLEKLPSGIEHLTQAQSLHLTNINSAITDGLLNKNHRLSEDRRKIANIPDVLIVFWENGERQEQRLVSGEGME